MGLVRIAVGLAWELPQNALGALVFAAHRVRGSIERTTRERGCVFVEVPVGAVSLGRFVFYSTRDTPYVPVGPENKDHEYGHTFQSRRLGPLYLPLVGVPSALRVLYAVGYRHVHGRRWTRYYAGFPERQADQLGGVDPSLRPAP